MIHRIVVFLVYMIHLNCVLSFRGMSMHAPKYRNKAIVRTMCFPKFAQPNTAANALVICGPSGVGKGTIISRLLSMFPNKVGLSVSHTTRSPRPGEVDGQHYHFVTKDFIMNEIAADQTRLPKDKFFIEYAKVHDNVYGTSFNAVEDVQKAGKICILDVDTNGVSSIKASRRLAAQYVFISPPSLETLHQRLVNRGTESQEQIEIRQKNAVQEMEYGLTPDNFDLVLVNDDLETAVSELKEYMLANFNILDTP